MNLKNKSNLIRNKKYKDFTSKSFIFILSTLAIVALLCMFYMIVKESVPAYREYGFWHMYFTADFSEKGHWGIWGGLSITLFTSIFATLIATPIALRTSIFIHYRLKYGKKVAKIIINILAGVPSVIFGVFALNAFGKISTQFLNIHTTITILNATLVLVIMIFPTLVSLMLNQLRTIPKELLNSSIALGNTKTRAIYKVAKKSIRAGIYISIITALGRAIGETMALSMILTNSPSPTPFAGGLHSFLSANYGSLGVQIAKLFYSDSDNELTRSALFAAGVALFIIIMILIIALTKLSKKRVLHNTNPLDIEILYPKQNYPANWVRNIHLTWHWFLIPFRLLRFGLVWVAEKLSLLFSHIVYFSQTIFEFILYSIFLPFKIIYQLIKKESRNVKEAFSNVDRYILRKRKDETYQEFYSQSSRKKFGSIADGFKVLLEAISFTIIIGVVFWILLDIFVHGFPNWSIQQWKFTYTENDSLTGSDWDHSIYKGVLGNTLAFTIVLVLLTIVIAIPFAFGTALFLSEYARNSSFGKILRFFLDSLGGTPSILFGIFGVILFRGVFNIASGGFSILAASLTMVLVIIPTFTRSMEQSLVRVPDYYRQASFALGASKFETIRKIILPQAFPGIITGMTLSAGRIVAETAPVYLLIGMLGNINLDIMDQGWTITTRILYNQIYDSSHTAIESLKESYALASVAILFITSLILFAEFTEPILKAINKFIIKPIKRTLKIVFERKNKKRIVGA